jgi:hypothetical protein
MSKDNPFIARNLPLARTDHWSGCLFDLLVVDRDAFAVQLAREWVRSGLPRSPVR